MDPPFWTNIFRCPPPFVVQKYLMTHPLFFASPPPVINIEWSLIIYKQVAVHFAFILGENIYIFILFLYIFLYKNDNKLRNTASNPPAKRLGLLQ
jgi:hypothetical protein